MDSVLDFFAKMVPEIGVVPTVLLVLFALMIVLVMMYATRVNKKKEELYKSLIEKQDNQQEQTIEVVKSAILEIKELSVMSLNEVSNLSGRLEGVVEIVKTLVGEKVNKGRDKEGDE